MQRRRQLTSLERAKTGGRAEKRRGAVGQYEPGVIGCLDSLDAVEVQSDE